jgi:uncharacterized protein YndB with AHSA1/START domain
MTSQISKFVIISAPVPVVWEYITTPFLMVKWMGEPEMDLLVDTEWKVGGSIFIKGYHHVNFENRGRILQFDKEKTLEYTHLSSVSRLPDKPENHSLIRFQLEPLHDRTKLTISVTNFPNEIIFKHLELYWNATIELIKGQVEKNPKV